MDVSSESAAKILAGDELSPTNRRPNRWRRSAISSYVLYVAVIIESFYLAVRDDMIARAVLYKVSIAIVSRSFSLKTITDASTHLN
jgi:hypothetical protein